MKTLVLLSLSLAVALGMPPFIPDVEKNPVLTENQKALVGDVVPEQGHVVVEDPLPQVRLDFKEQQEKLPLVPVDMKQSQSMVQQEVKVKPEVEQEDGVKTEVKAEPEVKVEQEAKEEPEIKVEQEAKEEPEIKVEQEAKAEPEPEVKVEQEAEEEPEVKVEQEAKEEPEIKVEQKAKEEPEIKVEQEAEKEPEVEVEQEAEKEPEVKVEQEAEEEPEVEQEAEEEPEVKVEQEAEEELEVKVEQEAGEESEVEQEAEDESEVKVEQEAEEESEVEQEAEEEPEVEQEAEEESEVKMEKEAEEKQEVKAELELKVDLEDNVKPEFEMEPELQEIPDFKVESEVQVEPELEPMFKEEQEVQEEFHVQMNLEEETEAGGESEERHIDMENKYDMVGETLMELEPLDDDNMFEEEVSNSELSEMEKSLKAAFHNQDQPLPEEEPIRELEPVTEEEFFEQQHVLPDAAFMEEGPALDIMGQPIAPMEEYFPNVEARMVMEPEEHSYPGENLMMEEPVNEYVNEEESYAVMRDSPGGVEGRSLGQNKQGWGCSSGMALEGKCYQFFKELKVAADAELFCQEQFAGGHLASITSQHIHRELVNMIHQQNGPYRAWVGGLRYKTGRFIWLDGSHWGYADWLSGEPSNVEDVECVEVLANREGKFNDFTCGEPQAFICSFPY